MKAEWDTRRITIELSKSEAEDLVGDLNKDFTAGDVTIALSDFLDEFLGTKG